MASSEYYQRQLKSTSQNLERLLATVRKAPIKKRFTLRQAKEKGDKLVPTAAAILMENALTGPHATRIAEALGYRIHQDRSPANDEEIKDWVKSQLKSFVYQVEQEKALDAARNTVEVMDV